MHLYSPADIRTLNAPSIRFFFVYLIAVVFNLHTLLTAYSSSTYLERFMDPEQVGLLYSLGALGSIALFIIFPPLLRRVGNVVTTTLLMVGSIIALWLVGSGYSSGLVVISFLIFLILNPLIYLNIDIFSETLIGNRESDTGKRRGLALSLMSLAALSAPLLLGFIAGPSEALDRLYFVAAGVGLAFLVILIGAFRHFYDPVYRSLHFRDLGRLCWKNKDLRAVLSTHFLLQIFFAWAIIYVPLFLATEVSLAWSEIGAIIAVGLAAYVIFEYPIGILADNYIGEKEMMAIGFLILALTTAAVSFMSGFGILGWMLLMFLSRVGASLVEVTTESYFFKKVRGEDANVMSLFRLTRPAATLAGALLGSAALLFLPFELIFILLAFVMVSGMLITMTLTDTR